MELAIIGMLLCLIAIFYQDLKYRRIHIFFPIAIFLLSFLIIKQELKIRMEMIAYNLFFFMLTMGVLVIYMSIKNKKFLNPFQHYFGLGDLLFYIAITPFFSFKNFIVFFIASMVFSIFLQLILKKFIKQDAIPLAGFSSVLLVIVMVIDLLLNFQKITMI